MNIITIDGPSGAGKTTISSILAKKYDMFHLKGGIFFRSFTYFINKNNINFQDKDSIIKHLKNFNLSIETSNDDDYNILINKEKINSSDIWNKEIDKVVPFIANYKEVRNTRMNKLRNISKNLNVIADGRALGTEVFPNATIKFFLTASFEERVKRKSIFYKDSDIKELSRIIKDKDSLDENNELLNKFQIPNDSIYLDSTSLDIDSIIDKMIKIIDNKLLGKKIGL